MQMWSYFADAQFSDLMRQRPFSLQANLKYSVVYFTGAGGKDAKIVHEGVRKKEHGGGETKRKEDKNTTDADKKKKELPNKTEKVKRSAH